MNIDTFHKITEILKNFYDNIECSKRVRGSHSNPFTLNLFSDGSYIPFIR